MKPAKRGEVWLVDLGELKGDHEQALSRPAVILQTDDLSHLNTVVIIPLTAQIRHAGSTHTVLIPAMEAGQSLDSVVLCHQVRALDRRKLIHKIGEMPPERLSEIEVCIMFVFGLPS